jgi:hypothetical protein
MNLRMAFALLEIPDPPATFEECFDRIGALEEKVLVQTIMPESNA